MMKSSVSAAIGDISKGRSFVLFVGDCFSLLDQIPEQSIDLIVSSPPYFIGKEYDTSGRSDDFKHLQHKLAPLLCRALKAGGSLCWQTGTHVSDGCIVPLDYVAYEAFSGQDELKLRNRIVWRFEHGAHCRNRFSGRHETILWFTKGDQYHFDLDAVRIPQLYPGKRHYKGPNKGKFSGHPLGKNPSDVWAIPNVKSKHKEKTEHPCQFPVAIPQRLIRALTQQGDVVFDPFAGVSSTGIAAALEKRRYIGCEIDSTYAKIGAQRYQDLVAGELEVRDWDQPAVSPDPRLSVSKSPAHFGRPQDGARTTG